MAKKIILVIIGALSGPSISGSGQTVTNTSVSVSQSETVARLLDSAGEKLIATSPSGTAISLGISLNGKQYFLN